MIVYTRHILSKGYLTWGMVILHFHLYWVMFLSSGLILELFYSTLSILRGCKRRSHIASFSTLRLDLLFIITILMDYRDDGVDPPFCPLSRCDTRCLPILPS